MTIKDNCEAVRKLLEQEVSTEDLDGLMEYLMDLKSISGLSAESVGMAKAQWRTKQAERIRKLLDDDSEIGTLKSLPASTLNDLVKGDCGKYEAAFDTVERLDKRISYVMDSVRTIISYRKAEMEKSI